ncbi:hypothetical protein QFC22_006561 [Naganishia vaughanmartiniae]|uniref:Uncharacterized protein n=1 Tax=Naganishia vaughanmartiniae TaxID=1424756 RepID=A0ACC2WIK6_9TREE|nr:hypothetical protein QFC22_006561 [Naganishia vaughanmartiniae]
MRQEYRQLSHKILRLATSSADLETLNKPKMVELKSWAHLGRRTQPPAFLFHRPSHLNRSSAAFEEMFPPSGLRACDEAEYREREALLVRFGDADDARSSPELSIMPNSNAGPSRFVDIKPKIPPNDIIDLCTLKHGPGSSRMPVSSSPASPLIMQPRSPRSPLSPVASVEPNDGKLSGKRPAEAMLSGTTEPESAKRVKEAEGKPWNSRVPGLCMCSSLFVGVVLTGPTTQSPETTRIRISDSPLCANNRGEQSSSIARQAQIEENIKADAEEAKRSERAWTVDSEMWADILRCDSDSEVEDVKPVIPQEPPETEQVSTEDLVEAGIEKKQDDGGEPALLQQKLGVKEISPEFLPRLKQAEADHVELNGPRQPLQKVILQPPVQALSAVSNETLASTHPQAVRGLDRAKVAIDVVRRQLTKVHVGSQLFLRIGRNEKGNYDVHQDVREESEFEPCLKYPPNRFIALIIRINSQLAISLVYEPHPRSKPTSPNFSRPSGAVF